MLCDTRPPCKDYQSLIEGINEGADISGLELEFLRQHFLFCPKCEKKLTPEAEKLVYGDDDDEEESEVIDVQDMIDDDEEEE